MHSMETRKRTVRWKFFSAFQLGIGYAHSKVLKFSYQKRNGQTLTKTGLTRCKLKEKLYKTLVYD